MTEVRRQKSEVRNEFFQNEFFPSPLVGEARWGENSQSLSTLPLPLPSREREFFKGRVFSRFFLLLTSYFLLLTSASFAATITGKANFTGTPSAPQKLDMNADPTCSSLHPEPVFSQDVVLNVDNMLQNVFVYVKEGLEPKTFETPKTPATLDQKGCRYTPHVTGLQVGQTLEIINSDSTLHNVHGMPKESKEFNLGMPIQGMKLTRKFDKPEVMVKFKCDVHPWMHAYLGVLPHPFFGVTGEDGSFEIKDLPAGTYTIEAWHEKFGTQAQTVNVEESGSAVVDFHFEGGK